ncbi:MAG: hypothetical protein QOD11_597 [Bradyrhizobium sp.]|jgi:hypothetical protein|nr:hypothetical protein [Bradyrhizobium sp.]
MRKLVLSLTVLGTVLISVLHAAPAQAQNQKTWVASNGIDNVTCGARLTPCLTFQFAHNHTNPGGEIGVVDSGDYGKVIISKSISIVAEGAQASILAPAAQDNGVLITAGPTDIVHLRGLTIDGGGTGAYGIAFNTIGAVHVEKCLIKNFRSGMFPQYGYGIYFGPFQTGELYVSDTVLINNGSSNDGGGIYVRLGSANPVRVVLNRVETINNFRGVTAHGGQVLGGVMNIEVHDSVAAGNTNNGIFATTQSGGGTIRMTLDRVTSANNGANVPASGGVVSDGPTSFVRITNLTVTGNINGLSVSNGGTLTSFGNNNVIDNSVDGMPSTVAGQR